MAALPGGGFVVAWTDTSKTGSDTSVSAIRAKRRRGRRQGRRRVAGEQRHHRRPDPPVRGGARRRTLHDQLGDGDQPGGRFRRGRASGARDDAADGQAIGGEFVVNSSYRHGQQAPSIAALPQGGFVTLWHSPAATALFPEAAHIVGQFHARGRPAGRRRVPDQPRSGHRVRLSSSVATLASGGVAVSWTQGTGNGADIIARLFAIEPAAITGSAGGDQLAGTGADDAVYGLGGNDVLLLQAGEKDSAFGGDGNDLIYFGSAPSPPTTSPTAAPAAMRSYCRAMSRRSSATPTCSGSSRFPSRPAPILNMATPPTTATITT